MKTNRSTLRAQLLGCAAIAAAIAVAGPAMAQERRIDIAPQSLASALYELGAQTGQQIIFTPALANAKRTQGASGTDDVELALNQMLAGTGLSYQRTADAFMIVKADTGPQSGSAAGGGAEVEALIVTAQKREEDIQDVPIAISAFSQEMLTERQVAGGPDLITQIPNFTFTKTNFASYSIQIRGIGTQAISVGTDPAVAVAFNGIPFIRNHFFEQEFYDVASVEILRGPQGTLFGRNATAGVVNVRSAPPVYRYEAKLSGDLGNYDNRRLEGMINLPASEDKLALRIAGEWTKRDGYSYNETTNRPTDGRDLWSTRVSLRFDPIKSVRANFIWEHFEEDDDRIRSAKQLCKKHNAPTVVDGLVLANVPNHSWQPEAPGFNGKLASAYLSQGCLPTSMYSDEAFQTPNGSAIPFVTAGQYVLAGTSITPGTYILNPIDPYASQTQSRDLRVFQSAIDPTYSAKNDTYELNIDLDILPNLTLTSQTGYSTDEIRSTQDFNRFNTAPGIFSQGLEGDSSFTQSPVGPGGVYCDPQLGCSTSMVAMDLSQAWGKQFSQELRLASDFEGPFNFSIGANFMRYKTLEDYYVFFNLLTAMIQLAHNSRPGEYNLCYPNLGSPPITITPEPFSIPLEGRLFNVPSNFGCRANPGMTYIDPNPVDQLDGLGHNYFRSKNPYRLRSYAAFGEAYWQVTPELKLTAGLRWTYDKKLSTVVPSQVYMLGGSYPESGVIDQEWKETTGRFVADWSPDLGFTDETMMYASYARGYKAGGANPPGPFPNLFGAQSQSITHPQTFEPEFVDAFEIGAKNTLLDGSLNLNASAFYYDYKDYQISQIVDRTSVNLNFDAEIMGLELEGFWQQSEALRFNFAAGLQDTKVGEGQSAIDIMDRTAGMPGWLVVKPGITETANCILPEEVVRSIVETLPYPFLPFDGMHAACGSAYYRDSPAFEQHIFGYGLNNLQAMNAVGFDPDTAPNNGEGFAKDLGGNQLPNAPKFTASLGAQFSMPIRENWIATFRADGYWAGNSYARIFNEEPYDKIKHRTNLNLAAILANEEGGWQIIGYLKNVFDDDFITGGFLNSDDTALTTNVFLNEPRLFGVRITKNW